MIPIKPGDLVRVGGAICAVPDTCEDCGAEPTEFYARGRDAGAQVYGLCPQCTDRRRAEEEWRSSLAPELLLELEELENAQDLYYVAANDGSLKRDVREAARIDLDDADKRIEEFRAKHGAPVHRTKMGDD